MKKLLFLLLFLVSCGKDSLTTNQNCAALYGTIWYSISEGVAFTINNSNEVYAEAISDSSLFCTFTGASLIIGSETSGTVNITSSSKSGLGCSLIDNLDITYSKACNGLTLCDSSGCASYVPY